MCHILSLTASEHRQNQRQPDKQDLGPLRSLVLLRNSNGESIQAEFVDSVYQKCDGIVQSAKAKEDFPLKFTADWNRSQELLGRGQATSPHRTVGFFSGGEATKGFGVDLEATIAARHYKSNSR